MGFGSDFAGVEDIDAHWSYLEGTAPDGTDREAIAFMQAVSRRFVTTRGGMFYDLAYGTALRDFIADSTPPQIAEKMIAAEARKDERVIDASCIITPEDNGARWKVQINVRGRGTVGFTLTLTVDRVSVTLLQAEFT